MSSSFSPLSLPIPTSAKCRRNRDMSVEWRSGGSRTREGGEVSWPKLIFIVRVIFSGSNNLISLYYDVFRRTTWFAFEKFMSIMIYFRTTTWFSFEKYNIFNKSKDPKISKLTVYSKGSSSIIVSIRGAIIFILKIKNLKNNELWLLCQSAYEKWHRKEAAELL